MNQVNRRVVLSAMSNADPAHEPRVITPEQIERLRGNFDGHYARGLSAKMRELSGAIHDGAGWLEVDPTDLTYGLRKCSVRLHKESWFDDKELALHEQQFREMGENVAIGSVKSGTELSPTDAIMSIRCVIEARPSAPSDELVAYSFDRLRQRGADMCQLSYGPQDADGARRYYAIGFRNGVGPVRRRVESDGLNIVFEDDTELEFGVHVRYVPTHVNLDMITPVYGPRT